jgi:anti-sigma factor RsiW
MTDRAHRITDDLLHAYVDGFLDEPKRRDVERYLAQNADAAGRVRAWQSINQGLLRLGDSLAERPGPALAWKREPGAARDDLARRRVGRRGAAAFLRAAAVAASLLVGVLGGWWAHDWIEYESTPAISATSSTFVQQAAVAYQLFASPQQGRPVELGAEQRELLQRWLSGKAGLNVAMHVPQLEALGWQLVGGRMLSDARGPAALYVYEDAQKNRLSLYVVALSEEVKKAGTWTRANSVEICDWSRGRLRMALAGQMERDKLKALLAPINEQILADTGAPSDPMRWPRLPDPTFTVHLNPRH